MKSCVIKKVLTRDGLLKIYYELDGGDREVLIEGLHRCTSLYEIRLTSLGLDFVRERLGKDVTEGYGD